MESLLAFTLGLPEVLIIMLVILLLFGATRIPQLMRGMGSGIKEFKQGLKEGEKESDKVESKKK